MYKVVFLAGPTASGKTEYAIKLAQDLNGEIVSADSMQLYKYMDIGSAKPSLAERAMVKHWLIDEIDPRNPFNVSEYKLLAEKYIEDIHSRGKLPIVCGGTGLYFNALLYDMDFSAPEGNNDYRESILKRFDNDPDKLHDHLESLDPEAAESIHKNNVKRVVRYIERLENGEEHLAQFTDANTPNPLFSAIFCGLRRDRDKLYQRIDKRVDILMKNGLLDEVTMLMDKGFTENDIAMKGIGYKELIQALKNGSAIKDAVDTIKLNTRHYAKRQIIWFRRYPDVYWLDLYEDQFEPEQYAKLLRHICAEIESK